MTAKAWLWPCVLLSLAIVDLKAATETLRNELGLAVVEGRVAMEDFHGNQETGVVFHWELVDK
eukprot:264613-Amphidinium_carterae.1